MSRPIYFPAIDGLRFLAFLLVFIFHSSPFKAGSFFNNIGWTGVELFFLLSGFLLTKLLVAEYNQTSTVNLYKYFIRRILRIWPLYFLYLLIIIIASQYMNGYPLSLQRLFGNIFFYDNIITARYGFNRNLASGHLWSISLEEQYYLILPFLIPWLIKQTRKKAIVIISVLFITLFLSRHLITFLHPWHSFIYVLPFSCDSFLAGIVLGLGIFDPWIKKINTGVAFMSGISFLVLLHFLNYQPLQTTKSPEVSMLYFLPAIAFFLIFIAVVYSKQGPLFWIFSNKPIRYLGKISFGLYIFHALVNRIIHDFFSSPGKPIDGWMFMLSLSITVLLSILSYELFEKYFLKMKSSFTIIKNRDV